jgi:shikimate dehydrogenase
VLRPAFAGVLGWPLEHTLSPQIHNAAFRAVDMNATYLPFAVAPEDLEAAVNGLRALGCLGVNVTMPHKEAIAPLLDDLSGDARAVGAVNTVQNLAGRLIGHNTDVDGFREFVQADAGLDISGMRALVLGSGGAARAIVRALQGLGASNLYIAARRPPVAEQLLLLADDVPGEVVDWDRAIDLVGESDLIVNATPLGMNGENPIPNAPLNGRHQVIDLIYDPPSTPLMDATRAGGGNAWGGLGMLVHQAAGSFGIWTGLQPPLEVMSAAALRALGSRHRSGGEPRRLPS